MAALKLVAQIAYLVAIVVALVKLVEQLIEELMPPKRFHRGIPIRTLLQKFCDYKGLQFSSSLMDSLDANNALSGVICLLKDKSKVHFFRGKKYTVGRT